MSRGPCENYTKKEAIRKVLRDETRLEALLKWECVNKQSALHRLTFGRMVGCRHVLC